MDVLIFSLDTPTNYIHTAYVDMLELKVSFKMLHDFGGKCIVQPGKWCKMVILHLTQRSLFELIEEPGLKLETDLF